VGWGEDRGSGRRGAQEVLGWVEKGREKGKWKRVGGGRRSRGCRRRVMV